MANLSPSVDEIDSQLYLGNLSSALSSGLRKELGITHILSVCPDRVSVEINPQNHFQISVNDSEYEDLLIHLPDACQFIQKAVNERGRVLVHCVMGVSRSATALSAFLMQSRHITASQALEFIRRRRPCVQPNYGFLKQLDAFAQCDYHPSSQNPAYISWKRRQEQNVTLYLNQIIDTVPVIQNQLFLSSEFPDDVEQADSLLFELGITHLLSISPSTNIPNLPTHVRHRHISEAQQDHNALLLVLPMLCNFIREAISEGGVVLVYCEMESKAALAAYGYLMCSLRLTPKQVYQQLTEALPLFHRTSSFTRQLELFDTCSYAPTHDHPFVEAWLNSGGASSSWSSRRGSSTEMTTLSVTAMNVLSETGLDSKAFSETLRKLQNNTRPSAKSLSPSVEVHG